MTTDLRPFSEWITDHARGTVDDEMTMAIAEVTEAVAHHDKPGTVVLKLKIEPAGNGGRTVATSCTVESRGAAGAHIVDCGVRPGYFGDRLGAIEQLAQLALERGLLVAWA
jgi:hypothetical protein